MIDLFALGVAVTVGVPGGLIIGNCLQEITHKIQAHKQQQELKQTLIKLFADEELKVNVLKVYIVNNGFMATLDTTEKIYRLCFLKYKINRLFGCVENQFYKVGDEITLKVDYKIVDSREKYKFVELPPTTLLIGYGEQGLITVDMLKTPHLGVVGTSNMGKSKCIEIALRNLRGADITLVNCFRDDFKGVNANKINGNKEILSYLQRVSENKQRRERPHYIVIDEYNVLANVRGVDKAIQDLLSQARHFNVFVIVLMQRANADDCKFKHLFNCRLAFRTIEDTTLRAFLGVKAEKGDGTLRPREFYLVSDSLYKGATFTS